MDIRIFQAASKYLGILEEKGCRVEESVDFESIPLRAKEAGRGYQLPTFDVNRVDHTRAGSFWMFLQYDGREIASAAAMLQDLSGESAASYLARTAKRQYQSGTGEALVNVSQALDRKMSGRLCYVGELAAAEKGDRVRLACFMRLVQLAALIRWQADWHYAFVPSRHVNANLDKLYAFTQRIPRAQVWVEPEPEKRASSEWWVGAPREELLEFFHAELHQSEIL